MLLYKTFIKPKFTLIQIINMVDNRSANENHRTIVKVFDKKTSTKLVIWSALYYFQVENLARAFFRSSKSTFLFVRSETTNETTDLTEYNSEVAITYFCRRNFLLQLQFRFLRRLNHEALTTCPGHGGGRLKGREQQAHPGIRSFNGMIFHKCTPNYVENLLTFLQNLTL